MTIPTWEELLGPITPTHIRHETDLDVPDEATHIRVHRESPRIRRVGKPAKKWVPDERYSYGLFSHRNPTYTEVEEQHYVTEVLVTWRVRDERFAGWVQLKEGR